MKMEDIMSTLSTEALLLQSHTDEGYRASVAMGYVNDYLTAARVQMTRIQESLKIQREMSRAWIAPSSLRAEEMEARIDGDEERYRAISQEIQQLDASAKTAQKKLWKASRQREVDIHFYFDCWYHIRMMMKEVNKCLKDPLVKKVFDKHGGKFIPYVNARDDIQHLDERLPGKPSAKNIRELTGDTWTFANSADYMGNMTGTIDPKAAKSFFQPNFSPASLSELEQIVGEWSDVVRNVAKAKWLAARQHGQSNP